MTACVNKKSKRVAAVVTASLVGALSIGAPAVALAANGTSIDMLALTAQESFAKASLVTAKDDQGRALAVPSDGVVSVEQGGWMVPAKVKPLNGDPVEINTTDATIEYFKGFNNTTDKIDTVNAGNFPVGNYTVRVTYKKSGSAYEGASVCYNFKVVKSANLADAFLFDNATGANDVKDTTFTYNTKAQEPAVALGDTILVKDVDYTISFGSSTVQDAGTYTATITGKGKYAGQKKVVKFSIAKLDLSKAAISIADVAKADGTAAPVVTAIVADGVALDTTVNTALQISVDSYSTDANGNQTIGECSATVSCSSDAANLVCETPQTVKFNIVDEVLGDDAFTYGGTAFSTALNIDLSDGQKFKPSKIAVKDGSVALPSSQYTVSYTDAQGNPVEESALQKAGVYFVKVRVNASATGYAYGSGTHSLKVVVKSGEITDDDIVFSYDGVVGSSFTKIYDGKDFLDQLDITVSTIEGKLVEGEDYTVKVVSGGKETDKVVDAAKGGKTYTITLDIPGYNDEISESDRQCTVTVSPLKLDNLYVAGGDLDSYTFDNDSTDKVSMVTVWYLGYTGSELTPSFDFGYYTNSKGEVVKYDANVAADLTWNALPAGSATVTGYKFTADGAASQKEVDSIKGKGTYLPKFVFENANFNVTDSETDNFITVSDKNVGFADVKPGQWYSDSVFKAKQLGYIKGVQDSNIFAPESNITRADALVIISRMSGFDTVASEDWLNDNIQYLTRYNDVNPSAYYAKAVAWATKVGVVHGSNGSFRPDDLITREEFAAMLQKYATVLGKDVSVDADEVLAGFADGSEVSDWAKTAVAWAAESKVMGNGGSLDPTDPITRAMVATMAVNYQPEGINQDFIG